MTPVVPFFRAWLWLAVAPPAVSAAGWQALFFVTNDCPISNQYAREIRRICEDYAEKGLRCELIYVNPRLSLEAARGHAAEFGHAGYTVSVDPRQQRARQSGVTVTPEVAVLDARRSALPRPHRRPVCLVGQASPPCHRPHPAQRHRRSARRPQSRPDRHSPDRLSPAGHASPLRAYRGKTVGAVSHGPERQRDRDAIQMNSLLRYWGASAYGASRRAANS